MQEADPSLIRTLRSIAADIGALDPDDRDALVRAGAALEGVIPDIPEGAARVVELLSLCLEGLQAIYENAIADPRSLTNAVAGAAAAAEQFLLGSPDRELRVGEAGRSLCNVMGRDPEAWTHNSAPKGAPPEQPFDASLNDAASLLMQLEPTDLSGLAQVREILEAVGGAETSPCHARDIIAEASRRIDDITEGRASDLDDVLKDVGRLIEEAMDAMEADEPPAPAPAEGSPLLDVLPADTDLALVSEFITESRELTTGAEAALLALETDPEDFEAVNTVFRAFHTIKGTSAFLGLTILSELAHLAESLLSRARDHEIQLTGGYADLALRSVDTLKDLLRVVQDALGGEPMVRPAGLDDLTQTLTNPEASGISSEPMAETYPPPRLGDLLVAQDKADREEVEMAAADQGKEPIGLTIVRSEAASLTDVAQALRTQQRVKGAEPKVESSVRVRTDRLDRLIDMVGELVIAQSMVSQDEVVLRSGNKDLLRKVTHTSKIVRELQDLSMSMRMVPLKPTFQKMARLVRDLAHKSGKMVNFVCEGEDTEIDRNMVDIINDPLVHMIRNALDHGVEPPDVRGKNGKPRAGLVHLSAYHSGGSVVVELRDDGQGLNREKIVAKAIAKGLIESDKGIIDSEIFNLIFEPGFSTADKVTEVSGRGVGMDVVKKGVEALRGRIGVASEPGKGSAFSLRLSLTMAITDGMLVKVGDDRFIIPTVNIHMSFRPDLDALSTVAGRGELVMLRGELMPVIRLHRLFRIRGAVEDPTKGLFVVLEDGSHRCALLVDELLGQHQVVAKPLGDGLGNVHGVSGGAILGDGRVGLILDPSEIASLSREPVSRLAA